ncbi:MAG TPA: prolyl oligopeptidase family serine peptidase [Longimicrobiales bacterium]|nr:prolyl oligopeptidase family serine peptidase [Longimicrobiales bacterium]
MQGRTRFRSLLLAVIAALALAPAADAQTPDYHRADVIRTSARYVFGTSVFPRLLEDSIRFWYTSNARADRGTTYVIDPRSASKRQLFDNARLAAALSIAADTIIDPSRLPTFTVEDTAKTIELRLRKKIFRCTVSAYACTSMDTLVWQMNRALKNGPDYASRSPDKKWDVFLYNYNLYARPAMVSDSESVARRDSVLKAATVKPDTTKKDSAAAKPGARPANKDSVALPSGSIQLTTDGAERYFYGGNFGDLFTATAPPRFKPRRVFFSWAPDSKKLAIDRMDYRNVGRYPLYSSTATKPADKSYYYAAAGDSVIPLTDVHIIDIAERAAVANASGSDGNGVKAATDMVGNTKIDLPPTPAVNFSTQPIWSRTSDRLFVMNSARGYKRMTISAVDAKTGKTTQVARDSFPSWVESRGYRVVNGGEDILWVSERDGWAHIYRFGADGKLKNQVESGSYAVSAIVKVDSVARQIYFTALGKEGGVPYYPRLYRVNFDGSRMTLLTPEEGSHNVIFIPKANFFVDTYAQADKPPAITLREGSTGRIVMELARGDVELLRSVGWTPPELFTVKARDGTTDLFGLMYKPSNFDSTRSYPIIDNIYPGPQVGSVGGWSFNARHEPRALAELGFIVIQLDHMGTPGRSKAFHEYYFGNMGDNGLPDHIAGIRQLAARHRFIDINRVGIYGHSGGGFASTDAILRYPDFFKVAVSGAGNHDNRTYGFFWGEKYQGLLKKTPDGKDNYEASANYTLASNLKGKLLLMHGDMDNNVHPANTLRVVDALIKANKDFDMLIVPDAAHGLPEYTIRKQWDYFVRHLLGVEPPANYKMMERPPFSPF